VISTDTFDRKKRVLLEITLDRWWVIERLAALERRDPRKHAAVLLERIATQHETKAAKEVA